MMRKHHKLNALVIQSLTYSKLLNNYGMNDNYNYLGKNYQKMYLSIISIILMTHQPMIVSSFSY